jgi:hypothetical protein
MKYNPLDPLGNSFDEWRPYKLNYLDNGDSDGTGGGAGEFGTGGGDWGSAGAFDASSGFADAFGGFDMQGSLAADLALSGDPDARSGPGEWGGWGSWVGDDPSGNLIGLDMSGTFARSNAPGGPFDTVSPFDVAMAQLGGGSWGTSGPFSAAGLNVAPDVSMAGTFGNAFNSTGAQAPTANLGLAPNVSGDQLGGLLAAPGTTTPASYSGMGYPAIVSGPDGQTFLVS